MPMPPLKPVYPYSSPIPIPRNETLGHPATDDESQAPEAGTSNEDTEKTVLTHDGDGAESISVAQGE
jgi:hypothetical protein